MKTKRELWPYRMKLEVGAYPAAPGVIRDDIRHSLARWQMDEFYTTAWLVSTELVNNAIQATDGLDGHLYRGRVVPGRPPIRFWMTGDGKQLLLRVWDASPRIPILKEPVELTERGRGLVIVDNLASSWGHYLPDNETSNSGKIVWASVTEP